MKPSDTHIYVYKYLTLQTQYSLLHPAHKGRYVTSLENSYIQLLQRCNTIINEQSQKDTNPFFNLIYNI